MKFFTISTAVSFLFLSLYLCLLIFSIKHSESMKAERQIQQECLDKDGLMIPRTYVCVKNDSVIKLENLK